MKSICRILLVMALVILFATPVLAVPWNVNDTIRYTLSTPVATPYGSGGLFTITNITTGAVSQSFCLELNEHIYNYDRVAGISDSAYAGGRGGGSPDTISSATDWLYAQFANGSSAYSNTAALQLAFWFLEQEVIEAELSSWAGKYFSTALLATANSYINDALKHNTGSYGTQVLNLKAANDAPHQSQLIRVSVPEPSTLLILGLGLIGVAGLRRRVK